MHLWLLNILYLIEDPLTDHQMLSLNSPKELLNTLSPNFLSIINSYLAAGTLPYTFSRILTALEKMPIQNAASLSNYWKVLEE